MANFEELLEQIEKARGDNWATYADRADLVSIVLNEAHAGQLDKSQAGQLLASAAMMFIQTAENNPQTGAQHDVFLFCLNASQGLLLAGVQARGGEVDCAASE